MPTANTAAIRNPCSMLVVISIKKTGPTIIDSNKPIPIPSKIAACISKQCSYIRPEIREKSSFHRLARKCLKDSCQHCGGTENLQVHHVDRNWKNNDPNNLQTLCGSCHMKYHWRAGHLKPQSQNLKRGTETNQSKPTETP